MEASSQVGAMLDETVDKVAERLTRLEVTVAEGFHANRQRFHEAELREEHARSQSSKATCAVAFDLSW
jgi:hypothetical protein